MLLAGAEWDSVSVEVDHVAWVWLASPLTLQEASDSMLSEVERANLEAWIYICVALLSGTFMLGVPRILYNVERIARSAIVALARRIFREDHCCQSILLPEKPMAGDLWGIRTIGALLVFVGVGGIALLYLL